MASASNRTFMHYSSKKICAACVREAAPPLGSPSPDGQPQVSRPSFRPLSKILTIAGVAPPPWTASFQAAGGVGGLAGKHAFRRAARDDPLARSEQVSGSRRERFFDGGERMHGACISMRRIDVAPRRHVRACLLCPINLLKELLSFSAEQIRVTRFAHTKRRRVSRFGRGRGSHVSIPPRADIPRGRVSCTGDRAARTLPQLRHDREPEPGFRWPTA
jgi:hypothetical protein